MIVVFKKNNKPTDLPTITHVPNECAYCGEPCERDFCCDSHESFFYSDEELDREDLKREERKVNDEG